MVLNLKRLRAERIACGITQDEMAHKMGWKTRTPYAKRENGIVDIGANEFIKMAKILGYETNNLDIFLLMMFPKKNEKQFKGGNGMKYLNLIKKALLIATTAIVTKKVLDRKGPKVIHQLNINTKDLEVKQLKINKAIRELEKSKNTIDELIDEGIPFETTF